ncbi:hypothetical protein [Candidatus Frankia alpina]|uniref:Uncharacterized protein n=1 Tax=Candidatus Frankia alpina TaxID=2699483 RepID=A0A4S5ET84_9ACTN|nr:hypothetical protein [Candidatus Frankia alpina]THJ75290.1 hypothetical protein E7Y31_06310 [Candidatus Frankia alpina]
MRWPWQAGRTAAPVLVDDGSLAVLASSFDPAAGEGPALAALAATGHPPGTPVLLRHLFVLAEPPDAHELPDAPEAAEASASDGAAGTSLPFWGPRRPIRPPETAREAALRAVVERDGYEVRRLGQRLAVTRQTVPTLLAVAQERARMTGLEMRLPVTYLGWQALASPPAGQEVTES